MLRAPIFISFILFLTANAFALKEGEKIKEFMLRDYNGELHYSSDLCGEKVKNRGVVIIDFFATWCEPCRRTLAILKKLNVKYGKKGLRVVLISFKERERAIREFVESNEVPFSVLMDKYGDMAGEYGVINLPNTFIIGGDCRLKRRIIGELINLEEELEKEVKEGLGVK